MLSPRTRIRMLPESCSASETSSQPAIFRPDSVSDIGIVHPAGLGFTSASATMLRRANFSAGESRGFKHALKPKRRLVVWLFGFFLQAERRTRLWVLVKGIHGLPRFSFQSDLRQFNGATAGGDAISTRTRSLIGEVNVGRLGCWTHVVDDNTAGAVSLQDRCE